VRPWILYGLLFAVAAALSALTILHGLNPHDEGLMLQAASRIADGQLPYRDFWWNYGPGQPLTLGALQEVFGPSLLTWRVLRVLLDAGVATMAFGLARRGGASTPVAVVAWLAAALAMASPSLPNPVPAATALGLGAVLLARRAPASAGVLAGLAVAFRIDLGLAAALGATVAAAEGGGRAALQCAGASAAAAVVSLVPWVVVGGPARFWDQTVGFALDEQGLQRLPLPGAPDSGLGPGGLLDFYMPYVLLAGVVLWFAAAVRKRPSVPELGALGLIVAGVLYLLARADEFHRIPLAAVLPALLAAAAWRERDGIRAVGVVLAIPLVLLALNGLDRLRLELFTGPPLERVELPVADGARAPRPEARSLVALKREVDRLAAPGEPVFVANPRHDLVRVGNPLLYVLLERPNPTRYDVMQPGVVTTAPVQRQMVRDLEETRPEVVVRWLSPVADQREDNGSGRSSGVRILDRYLEREYVRVKRIGDYLVLRAR
jgi:hypothetical protein